MAMNRAVGRLTMRKMDTMITSMIDVELLSIWRWASRALFSLKETEIPRENGLIIDHSVGI